MGSKRNKQHHEDDFNIGEEEAELFSSLKNAFSNLVIEESKGEKKEYNFKQNSQPHQFNISDHKAIAQQIDPDQMARQIEVLFNSFLPEIPKETPLSPSHTATANTTTTTTTTTSSEPTTTTSTTTEPVTSPTSGPTNGPTSPTVSVDTSEAALPRTTSPGTGSSAPPPSPVDSSHANPPAVSTPPTEAKQLEGLSDQEKFEKVENEIFLVSETVQYMQHVLPPTSQRTLECLGKVTDQYVKGWACIENKADLRQKYCVVLDKVGGWWLDEFLLFPELSLNEKEKWLNTFLRNWTRADGQSSGIENETRGSMRVAAPRRPTPPPSPPENPVNSTLEYDEFIARGYQQRYEAEHARTIGVRADSSDSMEDYYLAESMQRQEQEEQENRRIMSEIDRACADNEAKTLAGDRDNAEMGDGQDKPPEDNSASGEGMKDDGMGEGENTAVVPVVKEENMAEDKPSTSTQSLSPSPKPNHTNPVNSPSKSPTTSSTSFPSPNNNNNNFNNNNNSNNNSTNSSLFGASDKQASAFSLKDDLDMPSAAYAAAAAERYKNNNFSKFSKNSKRVDDDDEDEDELPPVPKDMNEWFSKHDEDDRSRRIKRGRSEDDLDDDSDSDDEVQRSSMWRQKDKIQNDRFDLLSTTWRIIKNMQIVGSMRFELYKKCGMYEECVKIARALNDREKIMYSRLLAKSTKGDGEGEKNDDDLEKAMKSMLHL